MGSVDVQTVNPSHSAESMASPSSQSLLGFRRLSVYLVDCLKTPADLRPQNSPSDFVVTSEQHDAADEEEAESAGGGRVMK